MEIISSPISRSALKNTYMISFASMVKGVVDVEKGIMALDAELHADQEALLLENGSLQENLWGINLYPDKPVDEFIEYTSLINIRPHQGNTSMEIENPELRERIRRTVLKLIRYDS
jgi:hypothetical protein